MLLNTQKDAKHLLLQNYLQKNASEMNFSIISASCNNRRTVENYIAECYTQFFQAHINEFLPLLLTLQHHQTTQTAVGLRPGSHRSFFLEQYLDKPIEQIISSFVKMPIDRFHIVEIGHLAVTQKQSVIWLFLTLVTILEQSGFQWMTFTATSQLQQLLKRLNAPLYSITSAKPSRLKNFSTNWGNYYSTKPQVTFCHIPTLTEIARKNLSSDLFIAKFAVNIDTIVDSIKNYQGKK